MKEPKNPRTPKKQKPAKERVLHDYYPTDPRLVDVLKNHINFSGSVFEPCAGTHSIANKFPDCVTNELYPKEIESTWRLDASENILWEQLENSGGCNNIITNPPYGDLAAPILDYALRHARQKVAFLLKINFSEPCKDRRHILNQYQDNLILYLPINPRPKFRKDCKGSDNSTVAWYVWDKNFSWKARGIKSPFQYCNEWNKDLTKIV